MICPSLTIWYVVICDSRIFKLRWFNGSSLSNSFTSCDLLVLSLKLLRETFGLGVLGLLDLLSDLGDQTLHFSY